MSRVNVRVRPANGEDVAALVALVRSTDLGNGVFSGRPLQDDGCEHLTRRFLAILAQPDRTVLVATEDADLVGLLAVRSDDIGAIDLTPVLHVTHLLVAPGHRRRGIGRSLLAAAVQLAEESGVEHLLATAAAGSREGNRYLARIGFAPLVVHRIAPIGSLRRALGMADATGRMAVLRRTRLARAQRAGFAARAVGRGA